MTQDLLTSPIQFNHLETLITIAENLEKQEN